MDPQLDYLIARRATDILGAHPTYVGARPAAAVHPGNEHREAGLEPRRWKGIADFVVDHPLLLGGLNVDNRGLTRDRHCFFEGPRAQIGIHGGRKRSSQLNPFASDGIEPRQRERHRVNARPQIDDSVAAGAVGDHRPDLLDEGRACRFDRHARHHGA